MPEQKINSTIIKELGLKKEEYERILRELGRKPSSTELGMFSAMWSEHCGYKHSRALLKTLPTKGPRVLQGPGENAGILDLDGKLAVAFKIESHNHPSALEPYQGAATGVGGILRDIFTMGARPVALLNSLRFGPLSRPHSRRLLSEVVRGIADYGNCVGIPTVGGEVACDETYEKNCLVNAMAVGLVERKRIVTGKAEGRGNLLIYIGATTGRDGIHGATFASSEMTKESRKKRSAVQVADPFMEKLLMEATLELIEKNLIVGIQDMGAAGLTCSSCEMAARGKSGVELDVRHVPLRETGMTPYEILLSESQERMLLVARPNQRKTVERILKKWDLSAAVIGRVTDTGRVVVRRGKKIVADVPAEALTQPPVYFPSSLEPEFVRRAKTLTLEKQPAPRSHQDILLMLLSEPSIASKEWIYRQYDHMVQTNTLIRPGSDAAVIRIKGTRMGLAMAVDGNSLWCRLDPFEGGKAAVAEAARNVACSGARPIGLTNCLNFGNPEKPDRYYFFERAVRGLAEAARFLEIPVTGGNVSFYNEGESGAVDPTPVVGVVGLLSDVDHRLTAWFKREGDVIYLLGEIGDTCGASLYFKVVHGRKGGKLAFLDLQREKQLQNFIITAAEEKLLSSAHDCSEGGLAVALAECCIAARTHEEPVLGAKVEIPARGEVCARLFGEAPSRVVVSLPSSSEKSFLRLLKNYGFPFLRLGVVGGGFLEIKHVLKTPVALLQKYYFEALPTWMQTGKAMGI